jgi:hypothetical protein
MPSKKNLFYFTQSKAAELRILILYSAAFSGTKLRDYQITT